MRQITGLIWHGKSSLGTQGLSLWAGAKGSLLLLPCRTATHKLQHESCAIFFHVAMQWCRGIPDTASGAEVFLTPSLALSSEAATTFPATTLQWEEHEEKGFPSTTSEKKSYQIPWAQVPIYSLKTQIHRGVSTSHSPSGTGTQLSPALAPTAKSVFHPSLPSHCSHHNPSQTLPCHFFTLGLEKRSCCSSSRCESSHTKSWLHSQGYHTRPQGTLWISNCTHVLHLLTHAHSVMSGAQNQW